MHFDYGEIDGEVGADGDPLDVYLGPDPDAPFVYVVHQLKAPPFEVFDEDKVMLGFPPRRPLESPTCASTTTHASSARLPSSITTSSGTG